MVRSAPPSLEVDGLQPSARERPATAEELARRLAEAAGDGQAVVPVGGGRALGMGGPLERFDLALETAGLDRVVDHSQADLTVVTEAGVTLEHLNEQLSRAGQFIPLDPFASPGHTIGGLLASGWSGPYRLRYGTPRDFLIGLRVALPDGRLASSGGRVVKNVSGYDMNKMHLGALGSLGVIVEAAFKLFPHPLHEVTVATGCDSLEQAWAEVERALNLKLPPLSLELLSPALGGWRLLGRVSATEGAVKRALSELGWEEAGRDLWQEHSRRAAQVWARVSVPPRRLIEIARRLPDGSHWFAHAGSGVLHWLDADPSALAGIRRDAEALQGSLVLLAAPPDLKRKLGAWGRLPEGIDMMRRTKAAFDPQGILSPGRYVV